MSLSSIHNVSYSDIRVRNDRFTIRRTKLNDDNDEMMIFNLQTYRQISNTTPSNNVSRVKCITLLQRLLRCIVHFVGKVERHSHEHILHEIVWCISNVGSLMPAYIGISRYHRFTIRRTKLKCYSHHINIIPFCPTELSIMKSQLITLYVSIKSI